MEDMVKMEKLSAECKAYRDIKDLTFLENQGDCLLTPSDEFFTNLRRQFPANLRENTISQEKNHIDEKTMQKLTMGDSIEEIMNESSKYHKGALINNKWINFSELGFNKVLNYKIVQEESQIKSFNNVILDITHDPAKTTKEIKKYFLSTFDINTDLNLVECTLDDNINTTYISIPGEFVLEDTSLQSKINPIQFNMSSLTMAYSYYNEETQRTNVIITGSKLYTVRTTRFKLFYQTPFYEIELEPRHISYHTLEKEYEKTHDGKWNELNKYQQFSFLHSQKTPLSPMNWNDTKETRSNFEVGINAQGQLFYKNRDSKDILDSDRIKKEHKLEPKEFKEKFLMFVISQDNKLYIDQYIRGKKHHNSLVAGEPVRSAGMIKIRDGKIEKLNFKSGHYKPDIYALESFISFLKEYNDTTQKGNSVFTDSFNPKSIPCPVKNSETSLYESITYLTIKEIDEEFEKLIKKFDYNTTLNTLKEFTQGTLKRNPRRGYSISNHLQEIVEERIPILKIHQYRNTEEWKNNITILDIENLIMSDTYEIALKNNNLKPSFFSYSEEENGMQTITAEDVVNTISIKEKDPDYPIFHRSDWRVYTTKNAVANCLGF